MKAKTVNTILCFFLVCVSAGLFLVKESLAVSAAPGEYILSQTDGTEFTARQWGDEWAHGWETTDGYSIVFDENTGDWTYAITDDSGGLVVSPWVVGRDLPPNDIQRHIRPTGYVRTEISGMRASQSLSRPSKVVPPAGTANIPVILVNFSDTATTYTATNFDTLLFGTGNNSMKDYYEEVSYGVFSVSAGPNDVAGWYTAANIHDYYGQNDVDGNDTWPGDLVYEAVQAADAAGFNFAPYDQDGDCYVDVVDIIHQGSGEEAGGPPTDIWSHRWSLNGAQYWGYSHYGAYTTNDSCPGGGYIIVNDYVIQPETLLGGMQTIGVFTHEYAHALGLPDLYDTDYSSNGIGEWGLMAGGSWTYVTKAGDRPSHMSAWSKYYLGWVTPTQVTGTLTNESITQAATTADVYQLFSGTPMSGEYFLVENRQLSGFDAGLPGAGLLIWHIDGDTISSKISSDTVNDSECYPPSSCSTDHYGVALVQADNLWDLEKGTDWGDTGDPYYSPANTSFTGTSSPNSNLYDGSPINVSVTNISASGPVMTATFTLSIANPDTTGVFRPSNGALYLKNRNSSGFADIMLTYGLPGDKPIAGDWNGDGVDTIGVFRNGVFYLRNSNTNGVADIVFAFGASTDQPVAGDWNGDGIDTIGVYRNGIFFLRNSNSSGSPDMTFSLGIAGDIGIAGDWDGDEIDTTGVFRPTNGALYLKNANTSGFADIMLTYGLPGDKPVTGDWDGDGIDTIGVYRNGNFMLRNSNTNGFADMIFSLGVSSDEPISGDWDGLP